jgi:hypothetical protein
MMREVDRLLAQLSHAGPQPDRDRGAPPPRVIRPKSAGNAASSQAPTRGDLVALWARLLLVIVLGGMMTQWPYSHGCDLPLLGYLGAVATVLFAGAGIAFDSWRLRGGLPHILSLILVFWGIVLTAEQVLPRIGYAADRASWRCLPEPASQMHSTPVHQPRPEASAS